MATEQRKRMADVVLEGVEKAYGAQSVLTDIDLHFHDGEFTVVVGPSGCGKSTLLRVIAGLDAPSQGRLRINGEDARGRSPAQRGVAMVFQSYALYPHLDVFGNMAFALRVAKRPQAEVRAAVEKAADLLGIRGLLTRKPAELSGGQRQRVAIGRAIVRQPRLLLLDEPLSNLDAALRTHMRLEFARLHRELKTTTIYVTHDQVEAMTLADKIIVLRDGRVEQVGTPLEIYHAPKNLFVAGFLGSPRINLLPGMVDGMTRGLASVRLDNGAGIRVAADTARMAAGDAVTLGIRPDALHAAPPGKSGNALEVEVDIVETLGATLNVHGLLADSGHPVTALLPAAAHPRAGQGLRLGFKPAEAYLFDASGDAIARTSRTAVS
jgi:multiple sugar transport system ATP-binding protein